AAVIISLISIYFGRLRASFEYMFHHNLPNIWQRHLTGAILTGVIAIVAIYLTGEGPALILGPGEEPIFAAFAGELTLGVALIALIAKMLATLTTIGSGGSAGLLVPSIFFGTMVAAALAQVFGYPADTLIVPAMAASLVSIVNVPLAAILFIAEVFGAAYMVPALVTLVVASILAHENPVYRTQREVEENQQIIPGYSIRRVAVPPSWAGQTIIELQIRQTYGLNVIGIVEQHSHEGEAHEHTQLNPSFSTPLELGQVLIVLGEDETIKTFERTVRQEIELAQRQASQDEASS
ncbi:MAG: chloride channel protein, partial [Chloroflexota bacterium]